MIDNFILKIIFDTTNSNACCKFSNFPVSYGNFLIKNWISMKLIDQGSLTDQDQIVRAMALTTGGPFGSQIE